MTKEEGEEGKRLRLAVKSDRSARDSLGIQGRNDCRTYEGIKSYQVPITNGIGVDYDSGLGTVVLPDRG